ncbi:MAG: 4Fe-4S binding protein [Candidatus Tritonobacter lacicola]|nr:4Fe-4S binding protein [Candidatus Tritonobacter lacicola]
MTRRKVLQAISFLIFTLLLSGVFFWAVPVTVSVSPLVGLANLIKGYPWTWKLLLAVPVIALALFKGHYFCFFICPTGTILENIPVGRKKKVGSSSLPFALLIVVLVSSFFTLAVVGLLDPLAIFAEAVNVFQYSFNPVDLWLVLPILVLISLNLLGRRYWCFRLCPLGALLRLVGRAGVAITAGGKKSLPPGGLSRRVFVSSLAGGLTLGWVWSRLAGGRSRRLIRPPGALPEEMFNGKCLRCGSCIKACVTDGIQPCFLEAGWDGIFTPRLDPSVGYCDEYCVACTWSCPTGALRPLTLAEKREERMGLATVDRERCMAWAEDKYCLVCQEHCPYNAIEIHRKKNGVPCPVVNPARCRGCGQCEFQCKTNVSAAIRVYTL